MICNRCKNKNRLYFRKLYCPTCDVCYYCLKCAHISIFKTCESVSNEFTFIFNDVNYKLNYDLTNNQSIISTMILTKISTSNIFINATCGAGKTELLFAVVKQFINSKKQVCFVSPRTEVTTEIYYRFNRAFNKTFGIITGEKKLLSGSMVFMTNHQLLNFQDFFDLIIVDEVDAYPLSNDKVLQKGIYHALNKTGKLIFMSATPIKIDKTFFQLTLSERYHKKRIPVPTLIKEQDISDIINMGKWIVFFPTIKQLEEVAKSYVQFDLTICHSKVTNIANKLGSLKDNFIIFSTAILERGITIENVNVIVYNASHQNFDKSTLIQISGRVGRVIPYTDGKVYFMTNETTRAIKNCIKYLEGLNDQM